MQAPNSSGLNTLPEFLLLITSTTKRIARGGVIDQDDGVSMDMQQGVVEVAISLVMGARDRQDISSQNSLQSPILKKHIPTSDHQPNRDVTVAALPI